MSYAIQLWGMSRPVEIDDVHDNGSLPSIEVDGEEYYLASDAEHAGEEARKYWADMAKNDPTEFVCIVGEDTLMAWALEQHGGYAGCSSLDEWLDLTATVPEEHWAGYDGDEREVIRVSPGLCEELGFEPTVAYRSN